MLLWTQSIEMFSPQYHIRIADTATSDYDVYRIWLHIVDIPACYPRLSECLHNQLSLTKSALLPQQVIYMGREQANLKTKLLSI